ncbi:MULTISPECIES: AraC family transcriptional regulator [Pseudomonas]|jgi:AraC-like DNA-binding protein|uniref:Transcriptional regulator, AraC family n=2 Tax=Pseudomonas putida group TaxID=136845 RepID=Q88IN9_PSEPK|nr:MULTISPECIES: AraC family transcriptional regulator [Pseudomonas]QNV67749.1 AraC family transcriptional regulator [Pseudomonas sp. CFA]AAN68568.2 transcriptional regulator, AraC family [Pseudomonas putida KT2440]AVD95511.1 AraC family transcriptional regulator [Pseudomonas sp. SWI36]EMR49075.1 AraC family transcriptional regulator [Pseudomonas putida LS46]KMU97763.1 AraC family transcriptional regulator [Pseudomonas putida]
MDRLSTLLKHFNLHASAFHQGGFCGTTHLGQHSVGHAHLLRSGRLAFKDKRGQRIELTEPTLILAVRPQEHHLLATDADEAELVCATLQFDGGANNPLTLALPDFIIKPLGELQGLDGTLDWLFEEAFGDECGRDVILNRLFELMIIQLLRHLIASRSIASGMMAGLANAQLSRALVGIHDEPQRNWSVAELANLSGMSRASFASHFREIVGITPADYLANWRISLTQKRLREGRPIALIADEVGYESPSALARTFRRKVGASPKQWLQQGTV